jgi:hypothetical protein
MAKTTITLSIEIELLNRLQSLAKENNLNISQLSEKIILTGLKSGEIIDVKCPICSNIYPNKLGFCPKCQEEIIKRETEIAKELSIIKLTDRLAKLKEWKSKGAFVSEKELEIINNKIKELQP